MNTSGWPKDAIVATVRGVAPVILALIVGALIIVLLGQDPIQFYARTIQYGLLGDNWMRSLSLLAPLLLLAVGLIVAFKARLWNLGYDGIFLLGALVASGLGPQLLNGTSLDVPVIIGILVSSFVVGAIWTLIPAFLKVKYGTNEIVTTLVMSLIGVALAGLLVKQIFNDPGSVQPQTRVIESGSLLPYIPGTSVHSGLLMAIFVAVAAYYVLTRTSFGIRLDIYGSGAKIAEHVGINSGRMVFIVLMISGGLIGLAGSVDILGQWSYQRASWDPAYGNSILPFVFLAAFNPIAVIPFLFFYAVFEVGGVLAAQQTGLSSDFLLVIVALILIFMTLTEYIARRMNSGQTYVPRGLRTTALRLLPRAARRGHGTGIVKRSPDSQSKEPSKQSKEPSKWI